VQNKPIENGIDARLGFWARLFGKKKKKEKLSAELKKTAVEKEQTPHEKFFNEMWTKPSFRGAFSYAKAEINSVIIKKRFGMRGSLAPN